MTYQMPEPFDVSEALKVSGNSHCLQDTGALQATHKLSIRQFLVYPDRPALNFSRDKIKEDRNRLSNSLSNLKIKNLSRVRNLGGTSETRLARKHPSMRGWRSLTMRYMREK